MDEKKQIEEMARIFANANNTRNCWTGSCKNCEFYKVNDEYCEACFGAKALYNAGYRRQSEGEWKEVYRNNQATVYECTNCNHLSFGISDYCICGAYMKGGAE